MSNPVLLTAHCLCGDSSLTVVPKSLEIGACHCNTCRKWSGGPFLAIESEQVTVTGDKISRYASSEWAERVFCQQCGTHLFYKLKDGHAHYVPVGLFAQQQEMVLSQQIFIDSKPHYYHFAEQTTNLTGEEVFAAIAGEKS
ncbi:MAG: GFA family protein [Pseudomonadota bacterium]|nr:GFA family protein [Pseudomonadota bacterium]